MFCRGALESPLWRSSPHQERTRRGRSGCMQRFIGVAISSPTCPTTTSQRRRRVVPIAGLSQNPSRAVIEHSQYAGNIKRAVDLQP
jgi:hypothetical protein